MRLPLAILLALAVPAALVAQDYAAKPAPDRIVLTWRGDPARSQAVTWRTDTSVVKAMAELAEGSETNSKKRVIPASTRAFKNDDGEVHFHSADFDKLTPGTRYAYRVGDGERWSGWRHFKTVSETPAKLRFLYVGDAQYELTTKWAPVMREAARHAPDAHFIIHAGDLVNHGGIDRQWGEWFDAADPLHRTMAVVPTPGNHEYYASEEGSLPSYWRHQFALPEKGPVGGVFVLDFPGVRLLCLNSNEKLATQAEWMQTVLARDPQRWTIATFHHPVFSGAEGRDNPELRRLWKPIFDAHQVDLILQGHDHVYGRSGVIGSSVYVVSVSGPSFYRIENTKWMRRKGEKVQLFQDITIDGDVLTFEARTIMGKLFDRFTLTKRAKSANALREGGTEPQVAAAPTPRASPATQPWNWAPIVAIFAIVGILLAIRVVRDRLRAI